MFFVVILFVVVVAAMVMAVGSDQNHQIELVMV